MTKRLYILLIVLLSAVITIGQKANDMKVTAKTTLIKTKIGNCENTVKPTVTDSGIMQ